MRSALWLAAALWAVSFPLFSTLHTHQVWGTSAAAGYLVAALVAAVADGRRGRLFPVMSALAGAVLVPLLLLVLAGWAQSEVEVIERSGALLVQQAGPYLTDPRAVTDYTPYLPAMALLGLPRALLGDGGWALRLLGDARIWCAAVALLCLWAGSRVLRRPTGAAHVSAAHTSAAHVSAVARRQAPGTGPAVLLASPLVALPLCVSGVDLPLIGLCGLGLALATRDRPVAAGLVLAAACAMKWTAWPAAVVAAALVAGVHGARPALRCAGAALVATLALVLPSALLAPGPMAEQVLAFPAGRGAVATPAASPLPGHLLAELGPWGWYTAVGLLLCGGLAVAVSLVVRPPITLVAAVDRLALGLSLAFLLAPAGRFGYFALPFVLVLWARLADGNRSGPAAAPAPAGPRPEPRTTGVRRRVPHPTTVPRRPSAVPGPEGVR
ncbi:hypothetical protein ACIP93_13775 [Streptomyces sp. NPDC088745]|uniref:hypothetical protein n=1 Tax=Streptomyces sp. NPDC088745 TaxID=3365884 RepID=UPI003804085A